MARQCQKHAGDVIDLFNTSIMIFRRLISIIPMKPNTKIILYILVLTSEHLKIKCDGELFTG